MLVGGRLWQFGTVIEFTPSTLPGLRVERAERWIDPVIGTRIVAAIGKWWQVVGYGDIGGLGIGSRFTWQLLGNVGYRLSETVTLRAGYRLLHVNFRNDSDGFIFDTSTRGWVLGVAVRP